MAYVDIPKQPEFAACHDTAPVLSQITPFVPRRRPPGTWSMVPSYLLELVQRHHRPGKHARRGRNESRNKDECRPVAGGQTAARHQTTSRRLRLRLQTRLILESLGIALQILPGTRILQDLLGGEVRGERQVGCVVDVTSEGELRRAVEGWIADDPDARDRAELQELLDRAFGGAAGGSDAIYRADTLTQRIPGMGAHTVPAPDPEPCRAARTGGRRIRWFAQEVVREALRHQ